MSSQNENYRRKLEISTKLLKMGEALIKEGKERRDASILQSGSLIQYIGGIMVVEEDILGLGDLCSMYSAKKILDGIDRDNNIKQHGEFQTDDYIANINRMMNDIDSEEDDDIEDDEDDEN